MSVIKYRPEVDGLRTFAVLPVILFHAGATWLPGGFIGVDIFFVISGYLITSIILREVAGGHFSFLRFYKRRIRRIIPALLLVIAVTLLASTRFVLPDQLVGTGKSAVAAVLSVSNIWFWTQSGYFSPASESMPLLHTWSLAVEEQFYIFFPILIVFLTWLKLPIGKALAIITLIAFIIGVWLSLNKPSVAYYLLPARAWELGLGALLAAGILPQAKSRIMAELLSGLGLTLLLFGLFWIDGSMAFPGWVALLPCLGAALVIHAAGDSVIVRQFFSAPPIVFVGLISYSLYLWHWPIFTIMRMAQADLHLSLVTATIGITLTFVCSVMSWHFVEKPFRTTKSGTHMPFPKVASVLGASATLILCLSALLIAMQGFPDRLSPKGQILLAGASDTAHLQTCPQGSFDRACRFGNEDAPTQILVVGDSHTPMLYSAFASIAEASNAKGVLLWKAQCPMLDGAWRDGFGSRSSCSNFRKLVAQEIRTLPNLRTVVLVGSWNGPLGLGADSVTYPLEDSDSLEQSQEESRRVFIRSLGRTLDDLEELDLGVVVLGPSPGAGFDVPHILALAELNGVNRAETIDAEPIRAANTELDKLIQSVVAGREQVRYVSIWDTFCHFGQCLITIGDIPIYSDGGHLSGQGVSKFLAPVLTKRVGVAIDDISTRR